LISYDDLYRLEVFDIDIIVLISLCPILELLWESMVGRRDILLLSNVSLGILIRPQTMTLLSIPYPNCPPISPLRVFLLDLIIELMQPLFLCLIPTQAFIPKRCKFLLTAKRIRLFHTKLFRINPWVTPTPKCLSGPILVLLLHIPRCLLKFLILHLQHSLLLNTV
jgi:hypothetical protein